LLVCWDHPAKANSVPFKMLFYYTVPRVSFYTESLVYHTQQQASG
jgi:hypothetical protein